VLADVLDCLECPTCGSGLRHEAGSLRCIQGHCFDVARGGYVNLLPGDASPGTADTAAMVRARESFLQRGFFEPIADAVASAVAASVDSDASCCVLETGAGTGYYISAVLDSLPRCRGIALDVSKHAARRAAHAHARIGAVVADTWRGLPVRAGVAAAVLDVFAPRNPTEFARVLAPGGALILVTPTSKHLHELVDALGLVTVDEEKESRIADSLSGIFELRRTDSVERAMSLEHGDVDALVSMGPSARHVPPGDRGERISALPDPVSVTLSVAVATYRAVAAARIP
jgi:23S rRNA (guanine745-N1)-methyltransferase